ncbi:MAG: glycosyltransferase family 2 protein [Bacteroidales bacterium]
MAKTNRKLWIALPAMDEMEYLPAFFRCLGHQSFSGFHLVVNVNQPEAWWDDPQKRSVCENNLLSLTYLKSRVDISMDIIDCASPGRGMQGKRTGVGWARKIAMDRISEMAPENDILISLDADTTFDADYFKSVIDNFNRKSKAVALSVPYYHMLTGDEEKDRAILHYEIYMRYYAINLWRIGNPFSFTAIGSAIALPVKTYQAIGGITPHQSGEDFYFLLKLRKYGEIISWNPEKVYPAARYSDRVGFGTGPAMIKGRAGEWSGYPVYPYRFFDEIKKTQDLFPAIFEKDVSTPMDLFVAEKFGEESIWQRLRENYKTKENFIRACHHKIDAFRILQYLKWRNQSSTLKDEENLLQFLQKFFPDFVEEAPFDLRHFSFSVNPVTDLDYIRNRLIGIEDNYQRRHYVESEAI